MKGKIPACEPDLGGNELAYVTDGVRSGGIDGIEIRLDQAREISQ